MCKNCCDRYYSCNGGCRHHHPHYHHPEAHCEKPFRVMGCNPAPKEKVVQRFAYIVPVSLFDVYGIVPECSCRRNRAVVVKCGCRQRL